MRKPVRCMLDRDEDMMITGTRHPFLIKYKVGFTKDGLITAAEACLYNNCGYSTDLSPAVSGKFRNKNMLTIRLSLNYCSIFSGS